MNIPVIFQFLKELSANNNREWFNSHRGQMKSCSEFENLLTVIISRISLFDESIRGIEAKDCTYRIYRDTRFSEELPTHIWEDISMRKERNPTIVAITCIWNRENCLLAGGSYCPPPPLLRALRQAVHDNIDEFRSIVEDPAFKQYFPVIGENFLKTAPKGFPKDYPYLKYLQCKEYTVACCQPDSFFLAPDFFGSYTFFKQMKRFSDFVNYTIDDFE